MLSYKKSLIILVVFLVCYETLLYFTVARNQPLWHDEGHFVETINYLAGGLNLERLKDYNEMSTPLPFLAYALWGKIAGFQLPRLRLFSLLTAFITFLLFYFFFYHYYKSTKIALILTTFLALQPYMIGVTIFVYTDMLTMLFLAASLLAFWKSKPYWFALSLAGGLLSRQYFIFWCFAAFIYFLWSFYLTKDHRNLTMMLSILAALIPLAVLFVFWKGLSPQNELQKQFISQGLYFHTKYLIFYVCAFLIYLSPLILLRGKHFYHNRYLNITSLILSPLYFLWPVKVSEPVALTGVFTTGYFHRLVRQLFSEAAEDGVYYFIFLAALPVFIYFLVRVYRQLRAGSIRYIFFSDLAIFTFLFTMSFSYLNWEKYLLPVIPFAILSVLGGDLNIQDGKSEKNNVSPANRSA